MTRRVATYEEVADPNTGWLTEDEGRLVLCDGCRIVKRSEYKVGEIVAIAQRYGDVYDKLKTKFQQLKLTERDMRWINIYDHTKSLLASSAGWTNKMFVRTAYMPHRIRITGISVGRMQNISPMECYREGILEKWHAPGARNFYYVPGVEVKTKDDVYLTPKEAFAALIDKTCGKGTWERNPWVFVYTFELVD